MNRPDGFTEIIEFTPAMRTLIADAIEALILLLDEIDGDADLEPIDEREPNEENDDEREFDQAEDGFGDKDGLDEQLMRAAQLNGWPRPANSSG